MGVSGSATVVGRKLVGNGFRTTTDRLENRLVTPLSLSLRRGPSLLSPRRPTREDYLQKHNTIVVSFIYLLSICQTEDISIGSNSMVTMTVFCTQN
jgi:hypothetical protein